MAQQQECWAESASHLIETGNVPEESDNFMGAPEDELELREVFQIDPDLLNDGEAVPDDSDLALQHQVIEVSPEIDDPECRDSYDDTFCHELEEDDIVEEADSHVIIDDDLPEEVDDFMGASEDELALHGAFRNEALEINPGVDPRSASEPAEDEEDYSEDMYLDWDQFMNDIRARIKDWDKKHGEFSRKEFGNFIYMRVRDSLKSSIIEEKFGGVFEDGVWGEDRWLNKVDSRLWDAFIDEICIMRLDLKRLGWDEIIEEWTRVYAENVYPERVYGTKFCSIWGLLSIIPDHLKSCQLIEKFNAEIKYDRQNDRMEITCDERLIKKAIEDFADKLNRLKPVFLKAKEAKADIESERYRMELAKANAANADEIRELRKELEAEREATQRAEAEIERLLAENKELEARLAQKAEAADPVREEAGKPLSGDPLSREREIDRLRHEWGDADLDILDRILAMKKELAPLEAEHSFWADRSKSLEEAIDNEIRRYCEDKKMRYWTEAEIAALPDYQDGKYPEPHPCKVDWRKLTRGFREKYRHELDEIRGELREYAIKCEDLRAKLATEERERAVHEKKYEAMLAPYGVSLDPSCINPISGLVDLAGDGDGQIADSVLPGLPRESLGCFAGPGGLGKTQLMTQLGLDVACGRNGLTKGGILYIYGEDAKPFMEQRRAAILTNASPAFSESELADIKANFIPWHLDGRRVDLADAQSEGTQVFRRNARIIERDLRRKGIRLRLIVLDTLSIFSAGKENLSEHTHALLDAMRRLCMETGASLIFLHHTTKEAGAGGNSGAGSVRGHSRLTDDIRWVTILSGMTEKEAHALRVDQEERSRYVKMTLAKCNSIAPQKPEWLRLDDDGVFVPADFGKTGKSESISGIASGSNREKNVSDPAAPSQSGIVEPDTAPVLTAQAMPEKRDAFADRSILQEPETPAITMRQADSSEEHIGSETEKPRSEKPLPVSRTGSSRFDRSFEG